MNGLLKRFWAIGLALILVVAGCSEDNDNTDDGDANAPTKGVYVANEGNFGKGNAALSLYDPETGKVTPDVFKSVNGKPLGDTANDIAVVNDRAYVVVNNSHAIEVLDTKTNRSVGRIAFPAGSGPYTITIDSTGQRGYVPLLLANGLASVNLATLTVEKTVEVGANPTEATLAEGKAFVTLSGFGSGTEVAVVDLTTFAVTKRIKTGDNPGAAVAANGKVIVLNAGFYDDWNTTDKDESTKASIAVIDPKKLEVTRTVPLNSGASGRLELGSDGKAWFIAAGALGSFDTEAETAAPGVIGAKANGATDFYGIGVDPESGRIYATDAKDYVSVGDVYVFEPSGSLVTKFAADIIPRAFGFVR